MSLTSSYLSDFPISWVDLVLLSAVRESPQKEMEIGYCFITAPCLGRYRMAFLLHFGQDSVLATK